MWVVWERENNRCGVALVGRGCAKGLTVPAGEWALFWLQQEAAREKSRS